MKKVARHRHSAWDSVLVVRFSLRVREVPGSIPGCPQNTYRKYVISSTKTANTKQPTIIINLTKTNENGQKLNILFL